MLAAAKGVMEYLQVKICGLMEVEHALTAAGAGADLLGFVMAQSRRKLTPGKAKRLTEAVRRVSQESALKLVGVFADQPPKFVNEVASFCGFDYVQLSGDEPWEYLRHIQKPVLKTLKVPQGQPLDAVAALLEEDLKQAPLFRCQLCVLEPRVGDSYGGRGQIFDWNVARVLSGRYQFLLAGGLTPENVAQAISQVHPYGVDVSSGVETDGVKDGEKIRRFVEVAKSVGERECR